MGIRISKDHLHPSVIESITSLIGDLNQLETTAKGNAVEAINELLANGGNKEELEALNAEIAEGKELIANAVGEPLTAEESFDEMSSDINSLLSTFKTNMMNNGIVVESGDKFKALIDKIATMVEEGSGKGIQFAEGKLSNITSSSFKINLDFEPYMVLSYIDSETFDGDYYRDYYLYYPTTFVDSTFDDTATWFFYDRFSIVSNRSKEVSVTKNGNELTVNGSYSGEQVFDSCYIAIGVGEEDTTLRDSLADILENKGVDVTEEDDMASLIIKVDEEFDKRFSFDVNKEGLMIYLLDGTGYSTESTSYSDQCTSTLPPGTYSATFSIGVTDINATAFGRFKFTPSDSSKSSYIVFSGKRVANTEGVGKLSVFTETFTIEEPGTIAFQIASSSTMYNSTGSNVQLWTNIVM